MPNQYLNNLLTAMRAHASGVWLALVLGLCAMGLNIYAGLPVMLCAVLLGLCVSQLYEKNSFQIQKGISWVSKTVLRIGVALLGLRIAFVDLQELGWLPVVLLMLLVISTILMGLVLSKVFKLNYQFGALTGSAVAICGASATMAVSSVLPDHKDKEHFTVVAILGMALLSTFAMITYPFIAGWLGMDDQQAGVFLGASIHDVAQVVGAGYSVSEPAGDTATLVKLLRVSTLMPILLGFALYFRTRSQSDVKTSYKPPLFLVVFFLLMTVNSLFDVPQVITSSAADIAKYALIMAIASIGVKSSPLKLKEVGALPFSVMIIETVWMAVGAALIAYLLI